jgi:phage-Barnase-EndoU-ColicinE5/D-RelE like nuclease2
MIFQDVTGEPVRVDNIPAHCFQPPLNVYAKLIARTIQKPQEIRYEWSAIPIPNFATAFTLEQAVLIRRYMARYEMEGEVHALTILTSIGSDGWYVRDVVAGEGAFAAARCGHLAYRVGADNANSSEQR